MRVIQAFGREHRSGAALPGGEPALPRREPRDRRPERPLLPVRRLPLVGWPSPSFSASAATSSSAARSRSARCSRSSATWRTSSTPSRCSRSSTTRSSPRSPRSTRSSTCSRRSRRSRTHPAHVPFRPSTARCGSTRFVSATGTAPRCCTASISSSPREPRSRSSAIRERASRRSRSFSRAFTTRAPAGSPSTAMTSVRSRSRASGRSSASSRRRGSCSPARSARTSLSRSPPATQDEIEAAARAVGADDFVQQLPNGYETQVGERGSRLSLGQRQLVAFARALLADPRILILDEATSSVDIATERRIEGALGRLLAGRTSFVIAHRLSTIRQADLIVVLEDGVVVEQGHARANSSRETATTSRSTATGRAQSPDVPSRRGRPGRHPGSRPARRSGGSQRRAGTRTCS